MLVQSRSTIYNCNAATVQFDSFNRLSFLFTELLHIHVFLNACSVQVIRQQRVLSLRIADLSARVDVVCLHTGVYLPSLQKLYINGMMTRIKLSLTSCGKRARGPFGLLTRYLRIAPLLDTMYGSGGSGGDIWSYLKNSISSKPRLLAYLFLDAVRSRVNRRGVKQHIPLMQGLVSLHEQVPDSTVLVLD